LALAVPLSRFTPRVGGGSAFFVMRRRSLVAATLVIAALGGAATLGVWGRAKGAVELQLIRVQAAQGSNLKAITVEFRAGPARVGFAEELKVQSRVAGRWLEPEQFPALTNTYLLVRTNRESVIFLVPVLAEACRFVLPYRTSSPYCKAYFFLQRHGLRTRFPGAGRLVLRCFPIESRLRYATPELALPVDQAGLSTIRIRRHNYWVQATPGCAFCLFLGQWSGAPDSNRWH